MYWPGLAVINVAACLEATQQARGAFILFVRWQKGLSPRNELPEAIKGPR